MVRFYRLSSLFAAANPRLAASFPRSAARVEQYRRPRSSYVLHLRKPPTLEELAAIEKARAEKRRFAILPRTSASVEEWLANYAPREALQ